MEINTVVKHDELNNFGLQLLRTVAPGSTALSALKYAIKDYKPV